MHQVTSEQYHTVCMIATIMEYLCHQFVAFIVYSKEDDDPEGKQVFELSNLLRYCGVECDIDLYHKTDDKIPHWSLWIKEKIQHCLAHEKSHILLVCSPKLYKLLEEATDNKTPCIKMVAGQIDSYSLNTYLEENVTKFLPVVINSTSSKKVPSNCVPRILARKTIYHFSYDNEDILDSWDFKSLVCALTGRNENHQPPGNIKKLKMHT